MNDLFISIDYNDREFEEVQSFKAALEKDYHCQIRPKWIPSCSEGAELWMHIFINSEIYDFLKNIIISGLIWDGIKYAGKTYIFTPLFKHLEKLNTDNEIYGGIRMERMVLQFDDCKIDIYGLKTNFTSILSSIFNKIATLKPRFEKEFGLKVINLKSATKPLNVLIAFTRPLITEFADNLNLKHPLLPTISPYPTM